MPIKCKENYQIIESLYLLLNGLYDYICILLLDVLCIHLRYKVYNSDIYSARHYKNKDATIPITTVHRMAQYGNTRILFKSSNDMTEKRSCQHTLTYNHGKKYIIKKGDYSHLQ